MKRELRFMSNAEVEVRLVGTGDAKRAVITGYAAVFNSPATIPTMFGDGFREVVKPGAFTRAIKEKQDVLGLVDHDPGKLIGRMKSGTLRLSEDSKGLRYEIDAPNTTAGNDIVESIRRGDVDGSSFGFRAKSQTWKKEGDVTTRELNDVDLHDVSPVTNPAYSKTSVSVRSLFPEGEPDDMPEEFRAAATKTVDGAELTADCFAYVGDDKKTGTWKLPIKFPGDEEKTKSHIRDALSRFDQTEGIPEGEKPKVLAKIKAAAKDHGIDAGEGQGDEKDKEKKSLSEWKGRMELRLDRAARGR